MGKKEQLEQIVSLLASDKIIIEDGSNNINTTQEEREAAIAFIIERSKESSYPYSDCTITWDSNTKIATASKGAKTLYNSKVTDSESFCRFIASLSGMSAETANDPVLYLYSIYFMMVGVFTEDNQERVDEENNIVKFNDTVDTTKLKEALPLIERISQIYINSLNITN